MVLILDYFTILKVKEIIALRVISSVGRTCARPLHTSPKLTYPLPTIFIVGWQLVDKFAELLVLHLLATDSHPE